MEIMIGIIVVGTLFIIGEVGLRYQLKMKGYERRLAELPKPEEPPKLQSFLLVSQDKFNSFRPQLGKNTNVPLDIALKENYSV